ncbi:cytochrome P450 [Saccharomonospora sp. NPDC046836]|uniref:cytochrome P450 n=1 Tax=Saccharomonospora sp. NPDC046836 TaxID=3156921 RepID=UPI00340E643C
MTESVFEVSNVDTDYDPTRSPHREDPFGFYAWSQQYQPVVWSDLVQAWLVTRYADIQRVAEDTATFSSSVAAPPLDKMVPAEVLEVLAAAGPPGKSVLQADPPEHATMRRIGQSVVQGPRINAAIPYMRQVAHELVDSAEADGARQIELVSQFSLEYVHRVLSTLVGVPAADMERVHAWNNAFLGLMAPSNSTAVKLELAQAFLEYETYLAELIAARRADPRDDMVSALIEVYDGDGIAAEESLPDMRMFVRGLYAGGIHTTKDAITSAVHVMLTTDGGAPWRKAGQDPASIPPMLEEVLRLEAPHRGLTRLALRDTTIGDVTIRAGEQVLLLFGAGNRDATKFLEPDLFQPGRDNIKQHMAFGHGIHQCLGRALARTEAREALTVLAQRLPGACLAPDYKPDYSPEFYFRGLSQLNLTW